MSFEGNNFNQFDYQDYTSSIKHEAPPFLNHRVNSLQSQEYPPRPASTPAEFHSGSPRKRDATDAGLDFDLGGDDEDKKSGRRKIKIQYIEDKSRRHITFSKRKAGIMKKAYELSTLTGTQVLLLVASETGHVYTFATPKLQPLITKPEGKSLIQTCLNRPDSLPQRSQTPLGTSSASYGNSYQPTPVQSPLPMRPVSAMSVPFGSDGNNSLQHFDHQEFFQNGHGFQNFNSQGSSGSELPVGSTNIYSMYPSYQVNQGFNSLIGVEDGPARTGSPALMMAANPTEE